MPIDINSLEGVQQSQGNANGMSGNALRAASVDPTQGVKAPNPTQVQVGGIQTPGGLDLSSIKANQAVINKLLGTGSDLFQQYVDSKSSQWKLEGQMAYAQGRTEDEIRQSGNAYTVAGYMATKVQTAADQMYQNEQNFISNGGGAQLTPDQYRDRLSKTFQSLQENINPQDDFTKSLLNGHAQELFPKLVSQQTAQNNSWLHVNTMNETQNNLTQLSLQSGISPDDVKSRSLALLSNIPNPEDRKQIISQVLHNTLTNGSENFAKGVLGDTKGTLTDNANKNAIGVIMGNENRGGVIQDVSDPNHVMGDMNARAISGINSAAFPKEYQEIKGELAKGQDNARAYAESFYQKNIIDKYGLSKYDPSTMAVLADSFTNSPVQGKKLQELADTGSNADQLLDARRDMYMQSAKNATPNSPMARNLSGYLNRIEQTRAQINNPDPTMQGGYQYQQTKQYEAAAREMGLNAAQVQQISSDVSGYYQDQNIKYANARSSTESGIDNAISTGATLPNVQGVIDANRQKFGNDWANAKLEAATGAIASRDAQRFQLNNAVAAAENHNLGNPAFSDEVRQQVLNQKRLDITSQIANDPSIPAPQKSQAILAQTLKVANDNLITDLTIKSGLHAGFSQNIKNPDGTLNKNVLGAYTDAMYIEKNSPPGTIANYLTEQEQANFEAIKARDGFAGANSAQAISAVNQMNEDKKNGTFNPPKVPKDFEDNISGLIYKQINPGWFSFIDSTQALSKWGAYSNNIDMHTVANDPNFKAVAQQMFNLYVQDNPHATPEDAMNVAATWAVNRAEPMPGNNLVFGSDKGSIRAAMGFGIDLTNNKPALAVSNWLKNNGKAYWGAFYQGISNSTEKQLTDYNQAQAVKDTQAYNKANNTNYSYQDAIKKNLIPNPTTKVQDVNALAKVEDLIQGIPPMYMHYDTNTNTFEMDPLIKQNGQWTRSYQTVSIPAKQIGDFYKQTNGYAPGTAQPYRSFNQRIVNGMQDVAQWARSAHPVDSFTHLWPDD